MTESSPVVALEHIEFGEDHARPATSEAFLAAFDITRVPTQPGCYIMRDRKGKVIYVGKAKNLRARVRSYINESDSRYSVQFIMRRIAAMDFLITTNEKEALLLENSLIKQHKPRYNVNLRDDKTYVSIRINTPHAWPKVTVTRKYKKDGSKYFGPYDSAGAVRETLRGLQRLFPLRTCTDAVLNNRTRPCLYYQMKQCTAPCVDYISKEDYRKIVDQVVMLLEGRSGDLETLLKVEMNELSEGMEFEKAAAVRDRLFALRRTLERQRTVSVEGKGDRDVFGLYTYGRYCQIQVLFFRGGKMVGGRSFPFNQREMPLDELFSSFLLQYYAKAPIIPREVLLPLDLEDAPVFAEVLSEQKCGAVSVHWPQRGDKRKLVDMAARNAKNSFEEARLAERANKDLLEQVQKHLKLSAPPDRIECFDISTIQGNKSVGSMVVFEGGQANKSRYRRYAIKAVEGQDDFASMREVLLRRYKRAIEENDLPDLVLIDGGKGQLNVATTVLRDLGIEDLACASIAKSRDQGEAGRSPERFFLPGRMNPIVLKQSSPVVLLLARIRDEAHRFAITYHRKRRQSAAKRSALVDIPGIGAKRAKTLLKSLGSVAKVREATAEEIAALPGFSLKLAQSLKQHMDAADPTIR
jgi:excinuclease ABC subunit C